MKTFYDVLNVSEDVSIDEITNSYKELKNKYESYLLIPGRKEKAEEMLKKLDVAYKVLGNEETKISYDKDLINMRNNELMNNLQKNTSEYNKKIELKEEERKKAELEMSQKKKAEEQEALNKKRIEAIQNAIEEQVKQQKKQVELKKQSERKIQKEITKEYKKAVRKYRINGIKKYVIAIIVVFIIVFVLSKVPFIRNYYIEMFNYLKDFFG